MIGGDSTNHVFGPLWQGDYHLQGAERFGVIVLAAQGLQTVPAGSGFNGRVLAEPLEDDHNPENLTMAWRLVKAVIRGPITTGPILITCAAGLNRSGLVTGLILRTIGIEGEEAVRMIRRARGHEALGNPTFEAWVRTTTLPQR